MIVAWKTEKVVSIQSRKHIKHSIKVSSATQTPQILSKLKPLYISVQKSYRNTDLSVFAFLASLDCTVHSFPV